MMGWNPFKLKDPSQRPAAATDSNKKIKILLGWSNTYAQTYGTPKQVDVAAQPKTKTPVPVTIPAKYLRGKTTCVGGKKIPYTRRQSMQKQKSALLYAYIEEEPSNDDLDSSAVTQELSPRSRCSSSSSF
ncbi:hypothetical protein LEN26_001042 [Aphanomyces euteiches]|nr:hypothetical protein AeMF1_001019 [Aphanomyces euteiches]KAH9162198.1 hypothetical protein LEN26_001042 [Aphanomyces euteiches]KAH9196326.1 hypothetical protein AeNC1_001680 [Aphanomyces euteiches]